MLNNNLKINVATILLCYFFLPINFAFAENNSEDLLSKSPTETVTVQAVRPHEISRADKNIYIIRGKPEASTATAGDLISKLPGVTTNQRGEIIIQGNARTSITINGSAVPREAALQFPGTMIDSIEIIANPSANYSSNSGPIINIILKAETGNRISNKFNVRFDIRNKINGYFVRNIRKGKLSISSNLSLDSNINQNIASNEANIFANSLDGGFLSNHHVSRIRRSSDSVNSFSTANYMLSNRKRLSLIFVASAGRVKSFQNDISHWQNIDPNLSEDFEVGQFGNLQTNNQIFSISYKGLGRSKIENSEARIDSSEDSFEHGLTIGVSNNRITNNQFWTKQQIGNENIQTSNINNIDRIQSLKLGFGSERSINDHYSIAYGFGLSHTLNNTRSLMSNSDPVLIDENYNFKAIDNSSFAYLAFNKETENLSYILGLRYENTRLGFKYDESYEFHKTHSQFSPSAHFLYNFENGLKIKLAAGIRSETLNYEALNPILIYSDANNAKLGNPNLRATVINWVSFETKKKILNFDFGFEAYQRYRKNDIDTYTYFSQTGAIIEAYYNSGNSLTNGIGITIQRKLGNFKTTFEYSGFSNNLQTYYLNSPKKINFFEEYSKLMLEYDFSRTENLNIILNFQGEQHGIDWRTNPKTNLEITYNNKFENSWSFSAEYFDTLSGNSSIIFTDNDFLNSISRTQKPLQGIRLSLTKEF